VTDASTEKTEIDPPPFHPAAEAFMRRMAPQSVQDADLLLAPALICHIRLLNSVFERSANRCAEEYGLTVLQWMALGCIANTGSVGINHSELGARLMLSKAPITGLVDRLVREGYAERADDRNDRRVSRILITARGEETWFKVRSTLRSFAIEQCGALSDDEQRIILGLLARLLDSASGADPILQSLQSSTKS
jgi:MarR family 2-MHQ and catechol resistance regulon transcriptional repressor